MSDHRTTLREMFAVCANERRMQEADALAAAIEALAQPANDKSVRLVRFIGINPLEIGAGATEPMLRDSWRFEFSEGDDGVLRFSFNDNGSLVATAATAQPAEAVEVFNCLDCPVSVESPWVAPRCPECGGPTELDSSAKPISDDAKRVLALESDPTFRAQYDDAAQGAVAPMLAIPEHIAFYQGPDDCPHLQLNGTSVAIFPAGSWAAVCDALDSITGSKATHPQAAPAQGDDTRRLEHIARFNWIGTKTRCEHGIEDGNADSLRAAIDAAAPSQEGEWIPDRIELEQVSRMCRPNSLAYADGWNACRDAMLAAAPSPEPRS